MKSSNGLRGFFTLLLVFAVLLAVYIIQDQSLDENPAILSATYPTPEGTVTYQRVFPDLETLQITAIRLQNPLNEETFILARDFENYEWTAPGLTGELDLEVASNIARTIAIMPYRRSFEIDENTDLTQYGFRPNGEFLIQFITSDGEEHVIAIGEPTFESPTFYALVDERKEVYLIERAPVDFLVDNFMTPPVD